MIPNAKMVAIDAVLADESVPHCRCWGLAVVLTSLVSWAVVIAAARLVAAAV
jgi:hypothetical protein